ncbi:MAG TPA: hypothetical protein VGE24_04155 [Emticicia sp.]
MLNGTRTFDPIRIGPQLKFSESKFILSFRGHTQLGSAPVKTVAPKVVVVKTPTVVPKQMPDIKYLGLIKNSNSGASTAIITLNGQSRLIKANDVIDGIAFKSLDKDELVAVWGKEKMVIRK